jgi:hypothetical protein
MIEFEEPLATAIRLLRRHHANETAEQVDDLSSETQDFLESIGVEPPPDCPNKHACSLAGNDGHIDCTPDPILMAEAGKR